MILSACPDGWEWRPEFGKCYIYRDDNLMTWSEANELCMTLDIDLGPDYVATLATVESEEENSYIFSLINYFIWLGGTDAEEEGVWRWVNLLKSCLLRCGNTLYTG